MFFKSRLRLLPIEHCSVEFAVYRQISAVVRKALRQFFIEIDSKTRSLPRMKVSFLEIIRVRKNFISFGCVAHVFLYSEIIHGGVEVQCCGHRYGRQVGGSVTARLHVIKLSQGSNLLQMRDAAGMNARHASVIDELLGYQSSRIPDCGENLADRQWRRRMLAHDPVPFLQFACYSVFKPEQMIGVETLSETCRFDRRETMMGIVQEMNVISILHAKRLE